VKLDALVRDLADVTSKWLLSKFLGVTLHEIFTARNKVLQNDVPVRGSLFFKSRVLELEFGLH
jgi:hypothetical protein